MPSTSKKQHNFMAAVAHNPAFAKKAGVPQSVGQEFSKADTGRKFKQGGIMKSEKASEMRQAKTLEKLAKEERSEAKGMKHGGHTKKMASGGMTTGMHGIDEKRGMTTAKMAKVKEGGEKKHGEHKVQERGHTRAMEPKMKGNTIGDGPLYNVKGPAMKRGGKTHHKK